VDKIPIRHNSVILVPRFSSQIADGTANGRNAARCPWAAVYSSLANPDDGDCYTETRISSNFPSLYRHCYLMRLFWTFTVRSMLDL